MAFIRASLIISVIVIFFSIVLVLLISRSYTRPLNRIIDRLHKISKGDADFTQKLSVTSNASDEIGMLSHAFNKMSENLLKTTASRDEINAVNQQLTANEQQLKAANQQLQAKEKRLQDAFKKAKESEEVSLSMMKDAQNSRTQADKSLEVSQDALKKAKESE